VGTSVKQEAVRAAVWEVVWETGQEGRGTGLYIDFRGSAILRGVHAWAVNIAVWFATDRGGDIFLN